MINTNNHDPENIKERRGRRRAASRNSSLAPYLLTVIALSLLMFLLPARAAALGSAHGEIAAIIVELSGDVDIFVVQKLTPRTLGRKWIPAEKGNPLHLMDRIRTRQGRVRIEFTDRDEARDIGPTIVNILDNSEVGIDDYNIDYEDPSNSGGLLNLLRGTIRNFLRGWGNGSGFSVRASGAVCSLRGTGEFEIRHDPEGQTVNVKVNSGEVVLTGPGGSRLIRAGENATMIRGALLEKPPA